ncbi:MAG: FBP domain-containing protein [Propioniciclava sp.]
MRALTRDQVLGSFVNATDAEQDRLVLPWWIDATLWDSLDYLGWADPADARRSYLVADTSFGLIGIVLRLPTGGPGQRRTLCNLCCTQHRRQGALLMVARRSGRAGRNHNTVGTTICADLACSLYVRGLRRSDGGGALPETLDPGGRVARLQRNLEDFLGRVLVD